MQTKYRTPSRTFDSFVILCCHETCDNLRATCWFIREYWLPRKLVSTSRCLATDGFAVLFWLHTSGVQVSCHIMYAFYNCKLIDIQFRHPFPCIASNSTYSIYGELLRYTQRFGPLTCSSFWTYRNVFWKEFRRLVINFLTAYHVLSFNGSWNIDIIGEIMYAFYAINVVSILHYQRWVLFRYLLQYQIIERTQKRTKILSHVLETVDGVWIRRVYFVCCSYSHLQSD
jgi:hypothetical protein